tara:strand:- start:426 stop:1382 length:957 start_codon:yes stop_codon:yes gene_type:complete
MNIKKFEKNSINIVAYHYIREIKKSNFPNLKGVEFNLFKKQVNYFKKNFLIISAEELIYYIENKKKLNFKKPLLLLSFDDGYKDHYNYVLPILIKEKIKGCFYPPIDIFKNMILNVNKLQFILSKTENKKKLLNEIINYLKELEINVKIKKIKKIHNSKIPEYDDLETLNIKRIIYKEISNENSNKICNYLFKKYVNEDINDFSKKLYISKKELKELNGNKMHIGSHGVNHVMFSTLSYLKQKKQIQESSEFFNKLKIDTNNFSLCYPWGSYNKICKKVLTDTNIKFALTSDTGNFCLSNNYNKFYLPRFDANEFKNI